MLHIYNYGIWLQQSYTVPEYQTCLMSTMAPPATITSESQGLQGMTLVVESALLLSLSDGHMVTTISFSALVCCHSRVANHRFCPRVRGLPGLYASLG